MSRPLLLGIDEGTTAVKAALFDLDLRPVAAATRRVATHHPQPGWVEQDVSEMLEAVVDAVAEVLDGDHGEVVACGLDHQGESVLAWDPETHAPLSPIVTWQDKRAEDGALAALRADPAAARTVRARSGLPLDPYFSAGKLAWLGEHVPAGARMGTVDAFLSDRLGAGFATDASTASRTQLLALGGSGWDAELADAFGVDRAVLPAIGDTAGPLGDLRHERWRQALPLRARLVDQQAALAGTGCVRPGMAKATYGTGVFVLMHAGDAPPHAEGLLPTVAWRIGGRTEYALDGGVFTAGALLEWLSTTLGLAPDPAALAALAAAVPDAGGVRILPALAGLGAPWWEPGARVVMAGADGATTPGHLARAALEAIAWRVGDIVEAAGGAAELRIDGGVTNAAVLAQLQADVLGVPVRRGPADATVLGSALLAGVGAGQFPTVAEAAERLPAGVQTAPRRDAAWRDGERAAWRAFVQAAAALEPAS